MRNAIRFVALILVWSSFSPGASAQDPDPADAPPAEAPQESAPAETPAEVSEPLQEGPLPEGPLPTYSVEITRINAEPIPGGPKSEFTLAPGDLFTVKFYLRDWSVNDQKLRSFQLTLDPASYTSGQSGKVQPINYGGGLNEENAYIDDTDPQYIHRGLHTIPAVDTSGPDYRWLSVIYDQDKSLSHPMDGTKFSCGTVHMYASDDAAGTFTIKLYEDPNLTMIINQDNDPIPHLQLEPLVLHVAPQSDWLRIRSSSPPSGAVVSKLLRSDEQSCHWDSIRLSSTGDASSLKVNDFQLVDGTGNPPRVQRVEVDPQNPGTVILHFSRGISPGRWTKVVHTPSQSSVKIGCLPGDVNNDGVLSGRDVTTLIEALNGQRSLELEQLDINGDSQATTADLAGLVDFVTSRPPRRHIAALP